MSNTSDHSAFKKLEHGGWNSKAGGYHDYAGSITGQAVPYILDVLNIKPGIRLLDIATGPGYVAGAATELGADVTGIDFAEAMIEQAEKNFPQTRFQQGDAEALDFADASFDAVSCGFGMLHLANPDQAIAEAYRVLRPGGRYAFTVWTDTEKHDFFRIVLNAIQTYGDPDIALPAAPPIFRFSDEAECQRTLAGCGFADIQVRELPLSWRPTAAEELLTLLEKSSVRAAMLLELQADENRQRIEKSMLEEMQNYRKGDCFEIAWPAVLVSGVKVG